MSRETSRRAKDYGLPRLTFEEAARVLGIKVGELMTWTMERLRPGPGQWSDWKNDERELPEALIRLYLTRDKAVGVATSERGQRRGVAQGGETPRRR